MFIRPVYCARPPHSFLKPLIIFRMIYLVRFSVVPILLLAASLTSTTDVAHGHETSGQEQFGRWLFTMTEDPFVGRMFEAATHDGSSLLQSELYLVFSCTIGGGEALGLKWADRKAGNHELPDYIRMKIDDGRPEDLEFFVPNDSLIVLHAEGHDFASFENRRLLHALRQGNSVLFRIESFRSYNDFEFSLVGSDASIRRAKDGCHVVE